MMVQRSSVHKEFIRREKLGYKLILFIYFV